MEGRLELESSDTLPGRATLLLLGLTAALLLFRLNAIPLVGPDEPRYARVAVEMHRAHDPILPTLQGAPWLEKPPLFYWVAGGFYSLFGETETASRLPSLVSMVLLVGTTALVGARLYGRSAGLHAGFILATCLLPFAYGHAVSMDMMVTLCLTLSVSLLALGALGIAGSLAIPAAWIPAAFGTLAKGPLGVLLPALILIVFVLLGREWGLLRRALSPIGLFVFLLVAAPWHILIWIREPGAFVNVYLVGHNLDRFFTTIHHHPGNILYYVPVLLLGLFPWSPLLIPGLVGFHPRASRTDRFVAVWFLAPFVFFTLAGSKLPGYILPCLPPLALVMGRASVLKVPSPLVYRVGGLLGVALGALVLAVPAFLYRMGDPGWVAALPLGVWGVLVSLVYSGLLSRDPRGAVGILRVGGTGFLLLAALTAPDFLARNQSGRTLFLPARGREVLAFGAWRTAWMAGYFYNDGKVREVSRLPEVLSALDKGPALVLAGFKERRLLEGLRDLVCLPLAEGPRGNTLLRVEKK